MPRKDPYEILGVPRNATQEEIKRTYRRLAKQYHPDRNPGDKGAEARFKEVQAAYEVLGDPERRSQFDRFGAGGPRPDFHSWRPGEAPSGFETINFDFGSMGDLSSIFEQFFSRSRNRGPTRRYARSQRERGADLEHEVHISFAEAISGTTREIQLTGGSGRGVERIEFHIPPGVSDGSRIRLKGKGHEGPGDRGDIIITCRVAPHHYFRREGRDLSFDLPLTFAEAACGAKVDVPTLDGITRVTIPAGTSSGVRLRLRGKGVAGADGERGDLYVITRIVAPKSVTPRARELIRQLEEELNQKPRADFERSRQG